MAEFPITTAREELGFTPSTAVRANIDVRQDDVGGAIGQALLAGAREVQRGSARKEAIRVKNRANLDSLSARQADLLRKQRDGDIEIMKGSTPPEKWEEEAQKITSTFNDQISGLDFSPDESTKQQLISASDLETVPEDAFIASSRVIATATIKSAEESLTDDYRLAKEDIAQRKIDFIETMKNNGVSAPDILLKLNAAQEAGEKLRSQDAVNTVHAAIEVGETTGNFDVAKTLATNSVIPEKQQTTLRTAISTAESSFDTRIDRERQQLIDKTTRDTVQKYYTGGLSVGELDRLHSSGLLKTPAFEKMREGLIETVPKNSDPFAAGRIRRAQVDFKAGTIDREEADEIILFNFTQLNGADRANVVSDLEAIEEKIIATAKTNAYSEGRGLMSQRFVGIQSEEELIDLFRGAGLTDEEKTRINRTFTVEVSNRDLYERAVDDRFREMQKAGISDPVKFTAESLKILQEYQKRKTLSLKELETTVAKEQKKIISGTLKPVSEMTEAEVRAEKARIRESRRAK